MHSGNQIYIKIDFGILYKGLKILKAIALIKKGIQSKRRFFSIIYVWAKLYNRCIICNSNSNGYYLGSSFGSSWHAGTNGIWEPGDWLNYKMGTTILQAAGSMFFEYDYYPYEYTITYNLNVGTNNSSNPSTYNVLYGISLKAPTRAGYTFTDIMIKTMIK